jgi:hypothetical protein
MYGVEELSKEQNLFSQQENISQNLLGGILNLYIITSSYTVVIHVSNMRTQ